MPPRTRTTEPKAAAEAAPAEPEMEQIDPAAEHAVRRLCHAIHHREPVDFQNQAIPDWVQRIIVEELTTTQELAKVGKEPPLCEECFPQGWAGLPDGAYAPGCQHGSWHHPGRMPGVKVLDGELAPEPVAVAADAEGGFDLGEDITLP